MFLRTMAAVAILFTGCNLSAIAALFLTQNFENPVTLQTNGWSGTSPDFNFTYGQDPAGGVGGSGGMYIAIQSLPAAAQGNVAWEAQVGVPLAAAGPLSPNLADWTISCDLRANPALEPAGTAFASVTLQVYRTFAGSTGWWPIAYTSSIPLTDQYVTHTLASGTNLNDLVPVNADWWPDIQNQILAGTPPDFRIALGFGGTTTDTLAASVALPSYGYFDNIQISAVPEPTGILCLTIAALPWLLRRPARR